MDGIIYQAKNIITGKSYIGQTITKFAVRKRGHYNKTNNGSNTYFHNALRKHGFENFEWTILVEGKTIDELNLLEPEYIEKIGTLAPDGYNLTTGGNNCRVTDVVKQKLRLANLGRKFTKEHKQKLSVTQIGKKITNETKQKMSIARLGYKLTDETRQKIRNANQGVLARSAKLTEMQVLEIREELAKGIKQGVLAKKFGISRTTICEIKNGYTWSHLRENR